jgi:hypothetical protein
MLRLRRVTILCYNCTVAICSHLFSKKQSALIPHYSQLLLKTAGQARPGWLAGIMMRLGSRPLSSGQALHLPSPTPLTSALGQALQCSPSCADS